MVAAASRSGFARTEPIIADAFLNRLPLAAGTDRTYSALTSAGSLLLHRKKGCPVLHRAKHKAAIILVKPERLSPSLARLQRGSMKAFVEQTCGGKIGIYETYLDGEQPVYRRLHPAKRRTSQCDRSVRLLCEVFNRLRPNSSNPRLQSRQDTTDQSANLNDTWALAQSYPSAY